MEFDFRKLKARMIEKYGSQTAFVKEFGCSENVFSQKMNNKVRFTTTDIRRIAELLEIETGDIGLYFFTLKV